MFVLGMPADRRRGVRIFAAAAALLAVGLSGIVVLIVAQALSPSGAAWRLPFFASLLLCVAAAGVMLWRAFDAYRAEGEKADLLRTYASTVLEGLPAGIVNCDPEGRITFMNRRARETLRLPSPAFPSPFREATASLPFLTPPMERLIEKREEFTSLEVEGSLGGERRVLRLDGRALRDANGSGIGWILQLQDVTEAREQEREILRTEKLAALGSLAAGLAHELKNPLAAVGINLQLLGEAVEQKSDAAKLRKYLGVVAAEADRLNGLLENYLGLARSRPIERAPTELERVLDATLDLVGPECAARGISIVRLSGSANPPSYALDASQIQQALLNLILNAMQATPPGGTITCEIRHGKPYATLAVQDTGPGVPAEDRERIFDLFYTTKKTGSGLGLYLAQRIVFEHGGFIRVESASPGARFVVGLPAGGA